MEQLKNNELQGRIDYRLEDSIGYITLYRPLKLNSLTSTMIRDLYRIAMDLLPSRLEGLIITGSEEAYSTGADIKEWISDDSDSTNIEKAKSLAVMGYDAMRKIRQMPYPIISVISGYCLGGGLQLALHSDLLIASEKSQIGFPESKYGLIPGGGGTVLTCIRIGASKTFDLLTKARNTEGYCGMNGMEATKLELIDVLTENYTEGLIKAVRSIREGEVNKKDYRTMIDPNSSLYIYEAFANKMPFNRIESRIYEVINMASTSSEQEGTLYELKTFIQMLDDMPLDQFSTKEGSERI